ncbi:108_t:CDS:2, partial [Funneliformis caledonium]
EFYIALGDFIECLTDNHSDSILQSKTNNAFDLLLEFNYSMYFTPTSIPTLPIISTL